MSIEEAKSVYACKTVACKCARKMTDNKNLSSSTDEATHLKRCLFVTYFSISFYTALHIANFEKV